MSNEIRYCFFRVQATVDRAVVGNHLDEIVELTVSLLPVDRFLNGLRLDDTRLCGLREYPTDLNGLRIGTLPSTTFTCSSLITSSVSRKFVEAGGSI